MERHCGKSLEEAIELKGLQRAAIIQLVENGTEGLARGVADTDDRQGNKISLEK